MRDRPFLMPAIGENGPQVEVILGDIWRQCDGPSDERDRLLPLTELMCENSQKVVGVGVIRIGLNYRVIERFGLFQVAGLMQLPPRSKSLATLTSWLGCAIVSSMPARRESCALALARRCESPASCSTLFQECA